MPSDPDDEPRYDHLDATTIAVRDLIGESRQLAGRMAESMGLNPNDMAALGVLSIHGPTGVAALAEQLGIRTSSATVMVDRLERSGHVTRTRDPHDRRRVTVAQTPAAQRASHRAWSPVIEAIDAVSRSLSADQAHAVRDFLERVVAVTRAETPAPPAGPAADAVTAGVDAPGAPPAT